MPTIQKGPDEGSGPSAVQVLMVRRHLALLGEPDHEILEVLTDQVTDTGLMRDVTRAKVGLDPEWPDVPELALRHGVPLARAIAAGREGMRRIYRALWCSDMKAKEPGPQQAACTNSTDKEPAGSFGP
ncbi:hypothetical protein DEDE109153_11910 [Deinococcus deserti]|uniref:Uncharacterized protein n=1 Tax=Deinococcus deserti (strain DSM 17065 / CIP 109153 / LMG 22923 / VCD115) TaxID=546414 RepID=C1D394_DEIDV|nr:hypothetical protein [Deinococcus deserti]ACO47883.1 Hypothetical protein Deide_2p02122 [Deinococcus deserti VCD115]